jgi:hypothetical protein
MGKQAKKAYKEALKRGFDPDAWNRGHERVGYRPNDFGGANRGPLQGFLGNLDRNQQFLVGALVGAAAAYVLTDKDARKKLMKSAVKLYADVVSGFEEAKEQMADLQAELQAEKNGQA